jgi:hypothetical protein
MRLTPEVKALRLAIKDLKWVCHEHYTVSAQADRDGFEFGINARKHYNEHQEAIGIIQSMLKELEHKCI